MNALSLSGVQVSYGQVPVLLDVDLEVVEGSISALVGTNGAGKSTVLRAATGLVRPSHGSVRLFGEDITRLSPEDRVGLGLVLVAGGRATFPSLSVEESVRIGTYTFRHDRSRVEEAVAAALAPFPRLIERRTQRAGTLSGGEQQLLALARALAMAPRVLLVDELTLGLAPAAADEVLAAVTALAGTGVTVLLVEQSIRRALAVAETAYFLERGQVRFEGPAAALATRTDLLRPVLLAP